MKFYIKQKVFSWSDTFYVFDELGNKLFAVKGDMFSFGKKLTILDNAENPLYRIEQEIFRFRPRYHILKNGEILATVVKEFSLFTPHYTVEGPGWEVDGDFFDHDYEITDRGRRIATVQKQWFTWGDTYEVDVQDDSYDPIFVLAAAIIIDCVLDSQDD